MSCIQVELKCGVRRCGACGSAIVGGQRRVALRHAPGAPAHRAFSCNTWALLPGEEKSGVIWSVIVVVWSLECPHFCPFRWGHWCWWWPSWKHQKHTCDLRTASFCLRLISCLRYSVAAGVVVCSMVASRSPNVVHLAPMFPGGGPRWLDIRSRCCHGGGSGALELSVSGQALALVVLWSRWYGARRNGVGLVVDLALEWFIFTILAGSTSRRSALKLFIRALVAAPALVMSLLSWPVLSSVDTLGGSASVPPPTGSIFSNAVSSCDFNSVTSCKSCSFCSWMVFCSDFLLGLAPILKIGWWRLYVEGWMSVRVLLSSSFIFQIQNGVFAIMLSKTSVLPTTPNVLAIFNCH